MMEWIQTVIWEGMLKTPATERRGSLQAWKGTAFERYVIPTRTDYGPGLKSFTISSNNREYKRGSKL
jgi:hypothetical protein